MKISKLGEFGIIQDLIAPEFKELVQQHMTGIGDDCAIIPINDKTSHIFTTDMLVENRHFLRGKISPFQLGYKSLAVNLSDIAAMGGTPRASYLSLGLPSDIEISWVEEFMKGYKSLSAEFNVPLLGGDTTSSDDTIIINVGVNGEIHHEKIKRRSEARSGDLICVTGHLGNSAAGLKMLLSDIPVSTANEDILLQHLMPRPHVPEGLWLAESKSVHAMIDLSDGIGSDLMHILKASGVAAHIALEKLPFSDALVRLAQDQNWEAQELAVSGGEDYVLLLTVSADAYENMAKSFRESFNSALYCIGSIEKAAPRVRYTYNGKEQDSSKTGFRHF